MKSTVSKNQPNSAEYLYMERPGMIKQSVLLKSFYKFNSIPVKILRGFFFQEPNKFIQKIKRINICNLKRSSKLPDIKTKLQ